MTTTTQLKPGDVVQHPERGYGIVYVDGTGETLVMHRSAKGRISIDGLTGWERAEVVNTPTAGEKPMSATVTLFCPVEGCGEPVEVGVHLWALKNIRDCYVVSECRGHRCKPPQPDEPTGLGAVVEVGGKRFVRTDEDGHPWIDNVAYWHTWDEITARGPVTVLSEGLAS